MKTLLTLRGFVVPKPEDATSGVQWYVNPAVNELLAEAHRHPDRSVEWGFQSKVLETLVPLWRTHGPVLKNQLFCRTPLARRAVDFTLSTLAYLETGRRSISIELWADLMDEQPSDLMLITDRQRDQYTESKFHLTHPVPGVLAQWLGHQDGFKDLLIASTLIFGDRWGG